MPSIFVNFPPIEVKRHTLNLERFDCHRFLLRSLQVWQTALAGDGLGGAVPAEARCRPPCRAGLLPCLPVSVGHYLPLALRQSLADGLPPVALMPVSETLMPLLFPRPQPSEVEVL